MCNANLALPRLKSAAAAPSFFSLDQGYLRGYHPGCRGHRADANGVSGMGGGLGASHSGEQRVEHVWAVNVGRGWSLERAVIRMMMLAVMVTMMMMMVMMMMLGCFEAGAFRWLANRSASSALRRGRRGQSLEESCDHHDHQRKR